MNIKKETQNKRKGIQGERVFEAYLGSLNLELTVGDYISCAFTQENNLKQNAFFHPVCIHYEDDYGIDFDAELFCEGVKDSFEPSGIHFFFQLKTHENKPKEISLKDYLYLNQQQTWGRKSLVVWQKINNKWEAEERKVLDFSRWEKTHQGEIGDAINVKRKSIPIKEEDWENLGKVWLENFINDYKSKILTQHFLSGDRKELHTQIAVLCEKLKQKNSFMQIRDVGYTYGDVSYPLTEITIEKNTFCVIACYMKSVNLRDLSSKNVPYLIQANVPIYDLIGKSLKTTYKGIIFLLFDSFLPRETPHEAVDEVRKGIEVYLKTKQKTNSCLIASSELKDDFLKEKTFEKIHKFIFT